MTFSRWTYFVTCMVMAFSMSAKAESLFRGFGACVNADMVAIERGIGEGLADEIFSELRWIFERNKIKIARDQVSVESLNFTRASDSDYYVNAHPVFRVTLSNGKVYRFSLGQQFDVGDSLQYYFSVGPGMVMYSQETNSLGEVIKEGCKYGFLGDNEEEVTIQNADTGKQVASSVRVKYFQVWDK